MSKIPSKPEILDWIANNPTLTAKREIAKAFGIKGAARIDLKRLLKELEAEGHLEKRKRSYQDPDRLPPVSVLQVTGPDKDGDLFAKPMEWQGEGVEPRVLLIPRASDPAMGAGDRILARLTLVQDEDYHYEARLIRRIGANPQRVLGIFRAGTEGGRIVPIDKGDDKEWTVASDATHGAKDGELVEAEQAGPKGRMGLPRARVIDRLGDPSAPKAVSLIAIHQHGIPDTFPDDVIEQADAAKPIGLKGREDHQKRRRHQVADDQDRQVGRPVIRAVVMQFFPTDGTVIAYLEIPLQQRTRSAIGTFPTPAPTQCGPDRTFFGHLMRVLDHLGIFHCILVKARQGGAVTGSVPGADSDTRPKLAIPTLF